MVPGVLTDCTRSLRNIDSASTRSSQNYLRIVTPDIRTLRTLALDYEALNRLNNHTPRSRGQRFNAFLAEVLQAWGLRARAEINSKGNIDVAFAIAQQRFILEAKWERTPTRTGPIAKLQKRVRQRLGGTIGVFVSMYGYTDEALRDVVEGERLEVILLDRTHIEAMLTGFCPPEEMIALLLDRAHFYGQPTVPLRAAVAADTPVLAPSIGGAVEAPGPLIRGVEGVEAHWAVRNLRAGHHGVAVTGRRLVLVTGDGLLRVGLDDASVERLPFPNDVSNVKVLSSGAIAVIRKFGAALIAGTELRVLGSPFPGRATFVANTGDDLVVFSNGARMPPVGDPSISSLGASPGQERTENLDYPAASGFSSVHLIDGGFVVLGHPIRLFHDGSWSDMAISLSNPASGFPWRGKLVIAGGSVELVSIDLKSGAVEELCSLRLQGAAVEVAMDPDLPDEGYLFAHETFEGQTRGAVVKFNLAP